MIFSVLQNASATFRIRGPDANTFLSGQFSQEIRGAPGLAAYGLWLNQKGKVVADGHVLRLGNEEHLVFAEATPAEVLRRRIEEYLIADEVELEDESGAWRAALLHGADEPALQVLFGGAPQANGWVRSGEAYEFPAWGRPGGWTWLLFPRGEEATWRERLQGSGREAGFAEIAWARILAGIPAVPADIGPDDLPNEGGLDATAISYTKGCYLGQEVMSRLKNLGQVRRRLHVVRGAGAPPAPRTAICQGNKRVGETRSAAPAADGFVAMAMLSLVNFDAAQPLQLGENGPPLEIVRHG